MNLLSVHIKLWIVDFYRCRDKREIVMNNSCDSSNLLRSHSIWKMQLVIAISHHESLDAQGNYLDAKVIYDKEACSVGKWLHDLSTQEQFSHLHSYLDCIEKHAVFHEEAGKVAELVNTKEFEIALKILTTSDSNFNQASDEVTAAIYHLLHDLDNLGILSKPIE